MKVEEGQRSPSKVSCANRKLMLISVVNYVTLTEIQQLFEAAVN